MVLGIAGLGEARSLFRVGGRMAAAHAMCGAVGGALVVAALWLLVTPLRTLPPAWARAALVAGIAIACAAADLGLLELPRQRRQVPQRWYRRYGAVRSYGLYGLWLGGALGTNITYMCEVALFAGAALTLPLPLAALAGAVFGLARAAPIGPLGASIALAGAWSRAYGGGSALALRCSAAASLVLGALLAMQSRPW
jgi:hypothetical protein